MLTLKRSELEDMEGNKTAITDISVAQSLWISLSKSIDPRWIELVKVAAKVLKTSGAYPLSLKPILADLEQAIQFLQLRTRYVLAFLSDVTDPGYGFGPVVGVGSGGWGGWQLLRHNKQQQCSVRDLVYVMCRI